MSMWKRKLADAFYTTITILTISALVGIGGVAGWFLHSWLRC